MKNKFFKGLVVSFALAVSGFANAGLITVLYGDEDGSFILDGDSSYILEETPAFNITDRYLGYDKYWDMSFVLDGSIISATLEIATAALGYGSVAEIYLDGSLLGLLTDTDNCDGSAAPGVIGCDILGSTNYAVDILSIINLSALTDGNASFWVKAGVSGDGWGMDYAKLTIHTETKDVPEPSTIAVFALGLMGLASRKYKKQA